MSWGIVKPRQAVTVARWLAAQHGPVLLGADANTPLIDAADFANARTHWYCGDRRLNGEPGDDCSLAQARFTRSRTVSGAGSLTIPPREPLSPVTRKDRWRSRTVPVSGRTHQALVGGSTPSG